jgi:N-acetylated-alpha-linked acidic dipeptidase
LLSNLGGVAAPKEFVGGLNITYNIGPGPATVNLYLDIQFTTTPIWNVIATITGQEADRSVILGNHRDAWVFGAVDPNSGSSVLLEVARSFGSMIQQGWTPQRTIILASWDAEEYGLVGSTAWAEANANKMLKQAVAYLNLDAAISGPWFYAGATHSLDHLLKTVADKITDPNSGKPISQVWNGAVADLGSGSDYTAFLDHFGVAATDMGFGGPYGVYHSIYDDIHWMNSFGDPTYSYHKVCAQFWGLMALKLVDSAVVPFNYTSYALALNTYYKNVATLLKHAGSKMSLKELESAISLFAQAANNVNQEILDYAVNPNPTLNDRLVFTERVFLADGLPRRPYYKHVIQAPGLYEGYAAQTFPGLTQAINAGNWTLAAQQYKTLYQAINNAAIFLSGNGRK